MAIIIPSKQIYEMDNPKVIENALKSIDIKQQSNQIAITNTDTEHLSEDFSSVSGTSETTTIENFKVRNIPTENQVSGTWIFNSTVNLPASELVQKVSFVSNNVNYTQITISSDGIYYVGESGGRKAYGSSWADENLRTLKFDGIQSVSGNFWSLLDANAVWQFMLLSGGKIETKIFSAPYTISRLKENYYITEIAPSIEVDFDVKISEIKAYSNWASSNPHITFYDSDEYSSRETIASNFVFEDESVDYNFKKQFSLKSALTILPEKINVDFSVMSNENLIQKASWLNSASIINSYYPYEISIASETDQSFELNVKFASKITVWFAQDYIETSQLGNFGTPTKAIKVELITKSSKLVYNETIRKMVTTDSDFALVNYVKENEATFSIGDNQFIRAETEFNGVQGAAGTLYNQTLALYQNGKETANLRVSVGEYFDENDNKAISVESADKMLFDEYDEVVPMVRNSWGGDEPISYNSSGLAKTFQVVGVRNVGDGAVWQELILREHGAIALKVKLPKPSLYLQGNILEITEPSGIATEFEVYANGRFVGIVNKGDTLDLSTLGLLTGKHSITAISRATNYKNSEKSRSVVYTAKPRLEYYTEVNESGGLTYHITAEEYKLIDGTYVIGD